MSRWPIGAHWCQHAYTEAQQLGLSYTWLAADGLTDDPRSVALHDADGMLASGLRYVLTFALSSEDRLRNTRGAWTDHVAQVYDRLRQRGALDRCLAVQLGDEWYTHRWRRGHDLHADSRHIAARAEDVRRIFGAAVGAGVGMAETGAVRPPTQGIDWWGLNVYLAHGYYDRGTVARIYAEAARLGTPLMPILPLFADQPWRPMGLGELGECYLPLLDQHAASIVAVGIFALHHPSVYAPDLHPPGRGVLELPPAYAAAVRVVTALYGD